MELAQLKPLAGQARPVGAPGRRALVDAPSRRDQAGAPGSARPLGQSVGRSERAQRARAEATDLARPGRCAQIRAPRSARPGRRARVGAPGRLAARLHGRLAIWPPTGLSGSRWPPGLRCLSFEAYGLHATRWCRRRVGLASDEKESILQMRMCGIDFKATRSMLRSRKPLHVLCGHGSF